MEWPLTVNVGAEREGAKRWTGVAEAPTKEGEAFNVSRVGRPREGIPVAREASTPRALRRVGTIRMPASRESCNAAFVFPFARPQGPRV